MAGARIGRSCYERGVTWPVFENQAFGDGRWFNATFESCDPDRKRCRYRVELFEGEQRQGDFVVQLDASFATELTDPEAIRQLRSRIGGEASPVVIVDGVVYRWKVEQSPHDGSPSFLHRGIVTITGDDGITITFVVPLDRRTRWWLGSHQMSAAVAVRAVEIARRSPEVKHHELSSAVVFPEPPRTRQDELDDLSAALAGKKGFDDGQNAAVIARCLLAIGCTTDADDREAWAAIDDWIASHANELVAARSRLLQRLLDGSYANRSAIQFLLEMCARVELDLGLDTRATDAVLDTLEKTGIPPRSIPLSHWWWRRTSSGIWIHPDLDP